MNIPMRQIHLDFHTSPFIPEVGYDFDADEFTDILKKAHVNSINLFAKCHHGMYYYPTHLGTQHPGLHGFVWIMCCMNRDTASRRTRPAGK